MTSPNRFRHPGGFLIAACLLLLATPLAAQDATRWEDDIQRFEAADAEQQPADDAILFVGSSSIRLWDLESSFPERETINRGFGGSQTSDMNHYFDRIVAKHEPPVIVVYEGDNDIAAGESAEQVAADYRTFLDRVAEQLPETHVLYLPIKPSLSRWEMWPEMDKANQLVKRMLEENFRWHYVDLPQRMFTAEGSPAPELFVDDGLHLNADGYKLWAGHVEQRLREIEQTSQQLARGVVYEDRNHNQRFDQVDTTLDGAFVSNGRLLVRTDDDGRYEIPVDNDDQIFVIKPRGYRTPLSEDFLPRFYYTHKPAGSPESRFAGVAPTGPLPDSIDFPLYPQQEPETFQALMFGDPQPRDQKEVDYVTRDVVEELLGTDAAFGVTLGDITFDNLALFEEQNRAIALLGIPWYNVIGNHDVNREAVLDALSDESFERVYGPPYYSFNHGPTHFVVLDDIEWYIDEETGRPRYRAGLGEEQLRFIREDLQTVPNDQLVVFMMHIPIMGIQEKEELYRLMEPRKFCISISGHTHHHEHRFLTREDGWQGVEPHHHIINVTVSGSWWGGAPDERGIPHTMMADGAPNGYSVMTFDGNDYALEFKAAGRPADYQMNIISPNEVTPAEIAGTTVFVNVFNGSEKSTVEMRLGEDGKWVKLEKTRENDPLYAETAEKENNLPGKPWRNLPNPKPSSHLWKLPLAGVLPADLAPGVHLLQVRTTDMDGRTYTAGRAIRLRESGD